MNTVSFVYSKVQFLEHCTCLWSLYVSSRPNHACSRKRIVYIVKKNHRPYSNDKQASDLYIYSIKQTTQKLVLIFSVSLKAKFGLVTTKLCTSICTSTPLKMTLGRQLSWLLLKKIIFHFVFIINFELQHENNLYICLAQSRSRNFHN